MTNETTASQTMQELVRDLYNFEGGRHFALRLENLIASQPKSIGDDAQFHGLMSNHNYAQKQGDFDQRFAARKNLVAYIDNFRAPAAQASATIQAAPVGWTAKRVDGTGYGNILYSDRQSAEIAISHNGPAAPKYEIVPVFAATIQEPVGVGEPVQVVVSLGDTWADSCIVCQQRGEFGIATQKGPDGCREAVESGEIYCAEHIGDAIRPTLAAPMVADPAGVAVDHDEAVTLLSAVFDAWENGDDCHEDGDPSATYMGKAFKLDDEIFDRCCALINRLNPPRNISAATVKAVPSEALSRRVGVPDNMIQWAVRELLGALPERRDWFNPDAEAVLRAEFQRAAPLADKTGGGE